MSKAKHPWDEPGFTFLVPGFPPGFVSQFFPPAADAKRSAKNAAISAKQSSNRDARLATGRDRQEPQL